MRQAEIERNTFETKIKLSLNLDAQEPVDIQTGVGFFDHMLTLFARHGRMSLVVKADGDLWVDSHHTVEDVGIVLGQALKEALGDKAGINRYGTAFVPMDETLGMASLDLSGRSFLVFDTSFDNPKLGNFDTELVEEFFQALAFNVQMNLHLKILHGKNNHHKSESLFKATGRALREAITINSRRKLDKGDAMIIVIDYDAGNTANVLRALEKIGVTAELSADKEKILDADGLILPGVGAYPTAMAELERRGLVAVIKEAVAQGVPLLGICLGMQILTEKGLEHEETDGLGFIPGVCRAIPASKEQPVPHMGWNDLAVKQASPLTDGLDGQAVYFVHSYFTDVPSQYIDVTADYSIEVPAMIHKDNVYGAQFHPEKSGDIGLGILEKFAGLCKA